MPIAAIFSPFTQTPVNPSRRVPYVQRAQRNDNELFQLAQIAVHVAPALAQINNRIADQLTGTVIGDAAAPLDINDIDCARTEPIRTRQMLRMRRATTGIGGGVLKQRERIACRTGIAHFDSLPLPTPRARIGHLSSSIDV